MINISKPKQFYLKKSEEIWMIDKLHTLRITTNENIISFCLFDGLSALDFGIETKRISISAYFILEPLRVFFDLNIIEIERLIRKILKEQYNIE